MSQNSRILAHLKRGRAINPLQALKLFGVMLLAARIEQLRRKGYRIITTPVHKAGKQFASYSLGSK